MKRSHHSWLYVSILVILGMSLLAGCSLNIDPEALQTAIQNDDSATIDEMLGKGLDVNDESLLDDTLLNIALDSEKWHTVSVLLTHGADTSSLTPEQKVELSKALVQAAIDDYFADIPLADNQAMIEQAFDLNQYNIPAGVLKTRMLHTLNKDEEAIALYAQLQPAIAENPTYFQADYLSDEAREFFNPDLYLSLSREALSKGDLEQAIHWNEIGTQFNNEFCLANLVDIYAAQGNASGLQKLLDENQVASSYWWLELTADTVQQYTEFISQERPFSSTRANIEVDPQAYISAMHWLDDQRLLLLASPTFDTRVNNNEMFTQFYVYNVATDTTKRVDAAAEAELQNVSSVLEVLDSGTIVMVENYNDALLFVDSEAFAITASYDFPATDKPTISNVSDISADGQRLLYSTTEGLNIWQVGSKTSQVLVAAETPDFDSYADINGYSEGTFPTDGRFSADEQQVTYVIGVYEGTQGVGIINSDGSDSATYLLPDHTDARWIGSNKQVVCNEFSYDDYDKSAQHIKIIDQATGAIKEVTLDKSVEWPHVQYNHAGDMVAGPVKAGIGSGLGLIDIESNTVQPLSLGAGLNSMVWSPNDQYLAYTIVLSKNYDMAPVLTELYIVKVK